MFNKVFRFYGMSNKCIAPNHLQRLNLFKFKNSLFYFSIFVKTQPTPNPHFLKFFPGKELFQDGETYDFASIRDTGSSPLARKLFEINGITRVFYGKDYISVGKKELIEWNEIRPLVVDIICDFFTKNLEIFDEKPEPEDTKITDTDSETVALIKEIISTRIRPVVQEDGGDIKFINFDTESGTVYLAMKGSCSGCPSSGVTLKNGIEKMLVHYVAEVKTVEAVDD
jgi:Fe-S cluster biogenesis protein NfuA